MDLVYEMYCVFVNWYCLFYFFYFSEDYSVFFDILWLFSGIFCFDVGDIYDYCFSLRGRVENDEIFSGKVRFFFIFYVLFFELV